MSREPRPWVFPKPYTSSCLWLVFIPWIRASIFTVAPKERPGNIGATLGISQFVNLSCVLKLQWSYRLLRITNPLEVSYVHRLASWSVALICLGVTPSLSVSLNTTWYIARWSERSLACTVTQGLSSWFYHLLTLGLFNFICLSIASKQRSSLLTNRC